MSEEERTRRLATETVESAALSLEGVDDVEGGDGLALGVLSVGDCVTDDALEEGLEDTAGLFVDHWRECQMLMWIAELDGEGTHWQRYA